MVSLRWRDERSSEDEYSIGGKESTAAVRFLRANPTAIRQREPPRAPADMSLTRPGDPHMTQPTSAPRDDNDRDLDRVAQELAGRLRARGVAVHDDDTPEAIVAMVEAVEAFEHAVEKRGGDLMVDEPPARHAGQPDDPHFLLPPRGDDESFAQYAGRLAAATAAIRKHKPHA
jgi:hypothetical protein